MKCRNFSISSEAVVRSCSVKKVFLKMLQNSQENTCARVSFLIKLQASGVFLWILQHLKNTFFYRTPLVAASVFYIFVQMAESVYLLETLTQDTDTCFQPFTRRSLTILVQSHTVFWNFGLIFYTCKTCHNCKSKKAIIHQPEIQNYQAKTTLRQKFKVDIPLKIIYSYLILPFLSDLELLLAESWVSIVFLKLEIFAYYW